MQRLDTCSWVARSSLVLLQLLLALIGLIDKCCEQAREEAGGAAPLATAYTLGENSGVLLIIQHVSLIPALVEGTCERA